MRAGVDMVCMVGVFSFPLVVSVGLWVVFSEVLQCKSTGDRFTVSRPFWRYACERYKFWRKAVKTKYGWLLG